MRLMMKKRRRPSQFTSQCLSQSEHRFGPLRRTLPTPPSSRLPRLTSPPLRRRRNRDTIAERNKELDADVIEARREAEVAERRKQAHDLVAQSITRELAASKLNARLALPLLAEPKC